MGLSRRKMLAAGCTAAAASALPCALWESARGGDAAADASGKVGGAKEALYWEAAEKGRVTCTLCPRGCRPAEGTRGFCGVRENRGGKYYSLVYGRPCAVHVDPIEKKPLFHYLPGEKAFSVGTAGCNLRCSFCQNWNISQYSPEEVDSIDLPPAALLERARETGSAAIAHTYNEPIITYEYMLETARLGREAGIPAVMISNGYIRKAPMEALCSHLGAVKIDLKAFTEEYYSEICGASLSPVKSTLMTLKERGIWFEIVVLLVTGKNDSADEVKRLSNWVVTTLSPDVPLHFSRYFPTYKLRLAQTPVKTMIGAYEAARAEGVNFVYAGNIALPGKADTICPGCGAAVVKRLGHAVTSNTLIDGKCGGCGRAIPGVWKAEDAFRRAIIA